MADTTAKLALAVARINKRFGDGTILAGREMKFKKVPRVPSGIFALDVEMGGGWPRGRISHMYGAYSVGKSTTMLISSGHAAKYCTWCCHRLTHCICKAEQPCETLWVDMEHVYEPSWSAKCGIDDAHMFVAEPDSAEQCVDIVQDIIADHSAGIIVIDSIPAMIPMSELAFSQVEKDMNVAEIARIMSLALRRWTAALNRKLLHPKTKERWTNMTTIVLLNQIRDQIGSQGLPQPPGGHAIRSYSSIGVRLVAPSGSDITWDDSRGKSWVEQKPSAKGHWVNFVFEKNKTFPRFRKGTYYLDFADAKIDNGQQIVDYAERFGIITVNGSWRNFGEIKAQGSEAMSVALRENRKMGAVEKAVLEYIDQERQRIIIPQAAGKKAKK